MATATTIRSGTKNDLLNRITYLNLRLKAAEERADSAEALLQVPEQAVREELLTVKGDLEEAEGRANDAEQKIEELEADIVRLKEENDELLEQIKEAEDFKEVTALLGEGIVLRPGTLEHTIEYVAEHYGYTSTEYDDLCRLRDALSKHMWMW